MGGPRPEQPYMPDYGVAEPGWEPLPWAWAAERLRTGRNFWLVTVSQAQAPHALPVWGVWDDGDQRFAFSCGPRSRKARNVVANPQVVVATESTVECLSVEGRARPLVDDGARATWTERYLAKYRPLSPDLSAAFLDANAMFEVVPERAFGVIEREEEFAGRATRWVFDPA
ncbi:MAG: pyridoxamine 5'-phosphate oxidase family protein [Acidimicrobiales bacterium]